MRGPSRTDPTWFAKTNPEVSDAAWRGCQREGIWAKAGKRRSRLEDAVNSARETLVALRLAGACGYLEQAEAGVAIERLESIVPVLWVLAYRR